MNSRKQHTRFLSFLFSALGCLNGIHDMFSSTDNEIVFVMVRFLFILTFAKFKIRRTTPSLQL